MVSGGSGIHINKDTVTYPRNFRNTFENLYMFENTQEVWGASATANASQDEVNTRMSTKNQFGIFLRLRLTAAAVSGNYVNSRIAGADEILCLGKGTYQQIWGFLTDATHLPSAADDYTVKMGIVDGIADPNTQVEGVYIQIVNVAGTATFQTVSKNLSGTSVKTSSLSVDLDTKYVFKIDVSADGSTVSFKYWDFTNNTWTNLTADHDSTNDNIPPSTQLLTAAISNYANGALTNICDLLFDYFYHRYDFTNTL